MASDVVVNSWNEWDPLRHVIVGCAAGTMVQAPEIAVQRDWPNQGFPFPSFGPYPEHMQAAAIGQLDGFATTLQRRGIRVDRPTPIDFSQDVATPDWEQQSMFGCMAPRDLLLTVGNEILEAPMSYRSRWFEYLCYRPLLEEYFKQDPNFRFEAGPKPRLTDGSYKPGWWSRFRSLSAAQQLSLADSCDWILTEREPLFDAADVMRFGHDIFVQQSMVTNRAGILWLERHFPNHRIHRVAYREIAPWHLDSTLMPIRPGLVLVNPVRPPQVVAQTTLLARNDWQIVEAPRSVLERRPEMTFCSIWLNMNLLVLDPKTVCVEASEGPLMDLLYELDLEVIPVPFYEVAPFGGGLHCATVDVFREGQLEDYFPRQVAGF
jgi:glycine amidinotransferase